MKTFETFFLVLFYSVTLYGQQPVPNLSSWGATNGQVIKATFNGPVWTNSAVGSHGQIQFNRNDQLGATNTFTIDNNGLVRAPALTVLAAIACGDFSTAGNVSADGQFIGDGGGLSGVGAIGRAGAGISSFATNGTLVWFVTNNVPGTTALPNGSICTVTDGKFYVRTNNAWLLK